MGFTVSAAARVLGVSEQTVVNWSKKGILRAHRSLSGWRYFEPREVERLAARRRALFPDAVEYCGFPGLHASNHP